MFIGHFGVGFGAKKLTPEISLGVLFIAAQFVDLLWPTLLLLGVETVRIVPAASAVTPLEFTHYPISHSLLFVVIWSVVVGGVYALACKNVRGALLLGILVLSHWLLDLIVHVPDLPLWPGHSPMLGFGLWESVAGTLAVEGAIFAIGVFLYLRATRPRDRIGTYSLWGLVAFLVVIHVANAFGEPPPSETAIAWVGQAQWLLVIGAFWIDKHRQAVPAS